MKPSHNGNRCVARSDTCGTHHHKRTTTPKVVEPLPTPFSPPIRPLQGRSLLSSHFRRWRILHHTAVSVCWTASPSICIRVCPIPHTGGHAGPPLQRINTPRKHTTYQCRGRPMCLPCARPFVHPTSVGRSVKSSLFIHLRHPDASLPLPSRDMDARDRTYPCPRPDIWTLMQEQYINVGRLLRAVFQAFAGRFLMSDIGNSITDIEKTTSDLENSMSDIGNGLYPPPLGRTVKPSHNGNRCVARSDTCGTHHTKERRPRRQSNHGNTHSCHPFDLFKVVPFFRRIPAGGAFCTTQRLTVVGQLRRPSASVRPVSHTGGHAGPPLQRIEKHATRALPPIPYYIYSSAPGPPCRSGT